MRSSRRDPNAGVVIFPKIFYDHIKNFERVEKLMSDVKMRDEMKAFKSPVNGKKIMVYNFCSNDFAGDMSLKKSWWKSKTPYVGKHKLDKRVEKNLELVEKFIDIGVPRKQIFISGHSCGGLLTLMLLSAYPEKVGGGISYMQACFGKLSSKYKVKKFIYPSTASLYGDTPTPWKESVSSPDPIEPYSWQKLTCEYACSMWYKRYGLPTVVFRLYQVFGENQRPDTALAAFMRSKKENRPITLTKTTAQSSFKSAIFRFCW